MQYVADLEPNGDGGTADHVRDRRPAGPHGDDPTTTCRGTTARARCGSATARSTSARTTSTAPCSTRSCCTRGAASACPGGCGRSWCPRRECASKVWREPDQGIWEARGEPQHYVSSKLMCWLAIDRAAHLAHIRGDGERAVQWRATAEEIRADILGNGVRADGAPAPALRHRRAGRLDAARRHLRLPAPGTPRLKATVDAIDKELTENGYVLRYRTDETDDGLSGRRARSSSARSGWSSRAPRSS